MRRVLSSFSILLIVVLTVSTVRGGERAGAAHGLSTGELLLLALSDVDAERKLAAQKLQQSSSSEVLAFFDGLRRRMGLAEENERTSLVELAIQRMRESKQPATPRPAVIHTETWVVHMSPVQRQALLKRVGLDLKDGAAILDAKGAKAFRTAVQADEGSRLLAAPRLSMLAGTMASLELQDQANYVRGYRELRRAGKTIADPQIDTINHGLVLRLEGRPSSVARVIDMDLRATWADLRTPLPVFQGATKQRGGLKIQVPQTDLTVMQRSVGIPNGRFALLSGPARPSGACTLILMHVLAQPQPGFPAPIAAPKPDPKPSGPLITADVRIIEVDAQRAAAFFGKHRPTATTTAVSLTKAEASTLLGKVEKDAAASVLSAPRLTVFNKQHANVTISNKVSYIQDYDLETTNAGAVLGDPILGTVNEGLILDFQPVLDAGGKHIRVTFTGTLAGVQRPIPEKQIEVSGMPGTQVTIQVPQVDIARMKASARIPVGGYVVVGGGVPVASKDGGRVERVVLVHVQLSDLDPKVLKQRAPK